MVERINFSIVFEEAKELNSNNTIDEEGHKNNEEEIEGLRENGEDGLENFFGERDLVKN